jgi:hypothetical protein
LYFYFKLWAKVLGETMKNKGGYSKILVTVMIFGIMFSGCGGKDEPVIIINEPINTTITITGITEYSHEARIYLYYEKYSDIYEEIAWGEGNISNGSVSFILYKVNNGNSLTRTPWTEKGSYIIQLFPKLVGDSWRDIHFYTNGQTRDELGIISYNSSSDLYKQLPKYTISSSAHTIDFSKFLKW